MSDKGDEEVIMATKKKTVKKKPAKKKSNKSINAAAVAESNGIHPPPCASDEIEFDDLVSGRRMCRKA